MTIVMGLDQHRAQITAEWVDTETGEISRSRVAPAHREAVRRFLGRFDGRELEVALEATTGWRFVVEELRAVGAQAHLAEPAETSALRGNKKHAKSDRADARHLRELLMTGRLPESGSRPTICLISAPGSGCVTRWCDERASGSSGCTPCSTTTGCPPRARPAHAREPCVGRQLPLPAAAREQITVGLAMIDALDAQLAPIDKQLRAYARRQAGCRALMAAHYGIGELTASRSSPSSATRRRFSSSREAVRYGGMDITVHASDQRRAPGHLSRQGPPALRWALYEAAQAARRARLPRPRLLPPSRRAARAQPRLPCDRAQTAQTQLPHPTKNSARRRSSPHEPSVVRARPPSRRCTAASSRHSAAATPAWTASKDRAAAPQLPQREPPHHHHVAGPVANPSRGPR